MDSSLKLTFFLFLASLLVATSDAIRCFQCSSTNDSACLDLIKYRRGGDLLAEECGNTREYFCRKIVQEIILPRGWKPEVRVTRGCGWVEDAKMRECYKADNDDHFETVCHCHIDDCNNAVKNAAISVMSLVTLVMTFYVLL